MLDQRDLTPEDFDLVYQLAQAEARESFWAFRQYIAPKMIRGWFQRDLAQKLQRFARQLLAGDAPILLLQTPPQHGKSHSVIDLVAWLAGLDPTLQVIYASFSDRLGIRANLRLQRTFDGVLYKELFPGTRINESNVVTLADRALRNREIMEFLGTGGSFRNTTVMGSVTGETLDLGVIDDPIKGRAEASSPTIRDKVWNWLTDDFYSRFSERAGLLLIMTRWHLDDPAGRMIEEFGERVQVVRYPAVAVQDEQYRKQGEALFPNFKSLDFLMKRKRLMTMSSWESVYQQNPVIVGGGIFPVENFGIVQPGVLSPRQVQRSIRYWDKAGTEDGGAFTCGVLMHEMKVGVHKYPFIVSDVRRGQWNSLDREKRIRQCAEIDTAQFGQTVTWVEQEPGSGGKESAESTIRNLAGFSIYPDKVTGSKEVRAEPYAAQVQGGNVALVAGAWNQDFLDEHENFPSSPYKDQVDAAGGAFNKLFTNKHWDMIDAA
jgi:predicted phage terminase large subunit-like protein